MVWKGEFKGPWFYFSCQPTAFPPFHPFPLPEPSRLGGGVSVVACSGHVGDGEARFVVSALYWCPLIYPLLGMGPLCILCAGETLVQAIAMLGASPGAEAEDQEKGNKEGLEVVQALFDGLKPAAETLQKDLQEVLLPLR